jgi:hypothetical protein
MLNCLGSGQLNTHGVVISSVLGRLMPQTSSVPWARCTIFTFLSNRQQGLYATWYINSPSRSRNDMPVRSFHSHFICAVASRRSCGLFSPSVDSFSYLFVTQASHQGRPRHQKYFGDGQFNSFFVLSSLSIGSEREST